MRRISGIYYSRTGPRTKQSAEVLSLDPPFVDWWTLFGFNTGGGPCRAWVCWCGRVSG